MVDQFRTEIHDFGVEHQQRTQVFARLLAPELDIGKALLQKRKRRHRPLCLAHDEGIKISGLGHSIPFPPKK